jgi:hypothetical protein
MRRLQKKLDFETCISRLPSIVPAYDSNGRLYTFSIDKIEARQGLYPSNYGLIPQNVKTPVGTVITFQEMADLYHFC